MAETALESKSAFASTLLPNLTAGLVLGFSTVIYCVSVASLIFSGPLAVYLPRGIAIVLVASAITILCTALLSSLDSVISKIQYNPLIVLAVAAASIASAMGSSTALLPTLLALITVTTLLTGVLLLLLGYFRLGGLMRYIPYPIIGGFLAGVGWLFVQGSFSATVGYPLSLGALPTLLESDELLRWLPGVVFGLVLFLGVRRIKHPLAMPGILLVGLVLVIIAVTNLLIGVSIGLILIVVIFVVSYSRANIFHHTLSGAEMSSNVERNAYQRRALETLGRQVHILELQGFIFFGTASAVLEEVRARVNASDAAELVYLILDFRRVTGLDSSVMFSLTRVKDLADVRGFTLVLTHLSDAVSAELERNGLAAGERIVRFDDLDHGLEWCEEQLLGSNMATLKLIPPYIEAQLSVLGLDEDRAARLITYLEQIQLKPGEYLIRQGEPFHDLYFIVAGQVPIFLEMEDGKRVRVHTPGAGTIVGELGFYLDVPRSASVIADHTTSAYRLTQRAMQAMKTSDPELAIAFGELMLRVVAERLVATNRTLTALSR